jgi:hypothetical protein
MDMHQAEHHEMQLQTRYDSGAEEWFCPVCGRRLVLQSSPTYSMTILNAGDEHVRHSGSNGGLRIGALQVAEEQPNEQAPTLDVPAIPESLDDAETPLAEELRPWLKWFKEAGFYDDRDDTAR